MGILMEYRFNSVIGWHLTGFLHGSQLLENKYMQNVLFVAGLPASESGVQGFQIRVLHEINLSVTGIRVLLGF